MDSLIPSKEKLLNNNPKTNGPIIIPVMMKPVTFGNLINFINLVEIKAAIKRMAMYIKI